MALFNCTENLSLNSNFTFNEDEYNTYSCPWHNNLTTAIMSFRTVKAFGINPASKRDIENFHWENSERFRWHSQQLLDLVLLNQASGFSGFAAFTSKPSQTVLQLRLYSIAAKDFYHPSQHKTVKICHIKCVPKGMRSHSGTSTLRNHN